MTSIEEQELREELRDFAITVKDHSLYDPSAELDAEINRIMPLISQHIQKPRIDGETSDGYHTFNELYHYRMLYNALIFNEWASQGKYDVHKSSFHSDGEPCFGGGWFVVVAETPVGQITNHYENKDWDMFKVPRKKMANKWDGASPQLVAERLAQLSKEDK
ncbi:MAG TPA: hypothetical protein VJ841_03475 [Candidatus Saccharimonadales bacterium]|nr:hypothetical protein [Candidatus Saccharimonadales bacterium]